MENNMITKPKSLEALQNEDWFLEKINEPKCSGAIVEIKLGKGLIKSEDKPVYGKVPVYLEDGKKVLCSIQNIKVIGFYD